MADNTAIKGPQDRSKVNVHEAWEVEYWTKKWNVSKQQLIDAVKAVGTGTAKVAAHLGKQP